MDHQKKQLEEATQKAKKMQITSLASLELPKDTGDAPSSSHQTIAYASAELTGSGESVEFDEVNTFYQINHLLGF